MAGAYVWLSQRAAEAGADVARIARRTGRTLLLLGLGLGLTAASSGPPDPVVAGYPESVAAPAGLRAGDLRLQPCRYRSAVEGKDYAADCGRLVVPENRHLPGGGRLIRFR